MKIYIHKPSYYLPSTKVTNEELSAQFPEWSAAKISKKTGIYSRHVAAVDESTSDMAFLAAEQLFEESDVIRGEIDFVLLCTQSPDYYLPTTACILQDRLGLSNRCGALDFNLGCSGYVYGLGLAKGLIHSGQASNVLLLTSEAYSKFLHPKDKGNKTIFGDAASATIVSSKPPDEVAGGEILNFVNGTDGSGAESLIVRTGGSRNFGASGHEEFDDYGRVKSDDHLYMDGGAVFNFTIDRIPKLIEEVLAKHDREVDEIDLYVFHQANRFMLNHLRKKVGIDKERFYIGMDNCGNTVSSTIPIALRDAMDQRMIAPGSTVLLAGFGVGLSWSGTIIQY